MEMLHGSTSDLELKEELWRTKRALTVRNSIVRAFLTCPGDDAYPAVLAAAIDALKSAHGLIGLLDENGGLVFHSLVAERGKGVKLPGTEVTFPCGCVDQIVETSISEKRSIISNEPLQATHGQIHVSRALVAPILFMNCAVGILTVVNKCSDYDDDDRSLLECIAEYSAPILHARVERNCRVKAHEHSQRELRENERRSRRIVELAQDGIWIIDSRGQTTFANRRMGEMSGYTSEELKGKPLTEYLDHHVRDADESSDASCGPCEIECRELDLMRKDGSRIRVSLSTTLIRDDTGRYEGALGMVSDISARTKAEHDLHAQKERLSITLRSIGDGVITTDRNGNIEMVNGVAEALLGWTQDEVKWKNPCAMLSFQDAQGHSLCRKGASDFKCSLGLVETVAMEVTAATKGGARIPVEVSCSIVRGPSGEDLGFVLVLRDRTRQKEIDHLKQEFLASITHDLKSPLTSILGFVQLIARPQDGELSPKKLEYVGYIQRSGETLRILIENILDSYRIEEGEMRIISEDFSLKGMIVDIVNAFKPQADEGAIRLEYCCPDELWAQADQNLIRRVFQNLLSNAIRYTPGSGAVSITARAEGERVAIEVSDTGGGIPEAEQGKLFRKFVHICGERRGPGLGLYIVKKILEGHGSDISCESEVGKGARFRFSLAQGVAPAEAALVRERLLVVGDEGIATSTSLAALKEDGYRVKWVSSGLDALQELSRSKFDAILVHRSIPDICLDDLLLLLRANLRTLMIPIVMLSAAPLPGEEEKFRASLSLPSDIDGLHRLMQSLPSGQGKRRKAGGGRLSTECQPPPVSEVST